MHITTLARLGLAPDATPGQITAALANPKPGNAAEAWNNEVTQYMQANDADWQTAWAKCQSLSSALYACYERDCATRNQQAMARQVEQEEAVIRGTTTGNSAAKATDWLRTANSDTAFAARLKIAVDAFITALHPTPADPIPEAALRHFLLRGLTKLEATR